MQPTGPGLPPIARAQLSALVETRGQWRVGQVLQAVAARDSHAGQTPLRIGRQLVQAQTGNLKLTAGQPLKLEVVNLSKDLPVLKLLNAMRTDAVAQALRQVLPNQRPLPHSLSTLANLAQHPEAARSAPQISRLVRSLVQQLPDAAKVSRPQGLRQAIHNSGAFLEAKLARAVSSVAPGARPADNRVLQSGVQQAAQGDLKANLLQLAAQLQQGSRAAGPRPAAPGAVQPDPAATHRATAPLNPLTQTPPAPATASGTRPLLPTGIEVLAPLRPGMPPRPQGPAAMRNLKLDMVELLQRGSLQRQVETALSRLKFNQLAAQPQDRHQQPEWLVELPVRRDEEAIDVWSLRIRRQAEDNQRREQDGTEGTWSVMLAFDLPGLGPVQAKVTLTGENRITTRFYSETGESLQHLHEHLQVLRSRLEQAGLDVEDLAVRRGQLPAPADTGQPAAPIVDDQA